MKLIKKFFSYSIGSVVGIIISIFTLPILTRLISPEEFGYATIFLNIGLIISTIALAGMDQSFIRFYNETKRTVLYKKTILVSFVIVIIIGMFLFLFDEEISKFILKDNSYAGYIFIYTLGVVILRYTNLILRMEQLAFKFSIVEICKKTFDFLFIFLTALLLVPNHFSLIMGYTLSLFISAIISFLLSLGFWKKQDVDKTIIGYKELIQYAFPLLFSGLLTILIQTMDKLFLNFWVSSEELGIYSATFKLIALVNIIQHTFALFWTPIYLERYGKSPGDTEFFGKVARVMSFVMITLCIVVILFKDILIIFLGSDYRANSDIIAVLVLMPAFLTMSETTMIGINLRKKSHYHLLITIIVLIISLALNILLIPIMGIEGAAISVGVSYFSLYLLRTLLGQNLFKFDFKFVPTILVTIILMTWVIAILIIDGIFIIYGGASILILLLIFLFNDDLKYFKETFSTLLKNKGRKK